MNTELSSVQAHYHLWKLLAGGWGVGTGFLEFSSGG